MEVLLVFICRRGTMRYDGALLVAAPCREDARQIFREREGEEPMEIEDLYDVTAYGQPRILYDERR